MAVKVAINGFGRIGRLAFRQIAVTLQVKVCRKEFKLCNVDRLLNLSASASLFTRVRANSAD